MTTVIEVTQYQAECAICGEECEVAEVEDIDGDGPCDLDLRSAEPVRSNIGWWAQMCPTCGYSSDRIYEAFEGAEAVVMSEEYQSLCGATSDLHPVARAFRLASHISTQLDDIPGACRFALYQAWAHDDLEEEGSAMSTRLVAAALLKQIHDREEQAFEQYGLDILFEVDLLRRAGKFAQAALACQNGLAEYLDEGTKEVLVFQINLCEQKDRRCHTMEEVFQRVEYQEYDA